jgi:hypothetical protein
MFAFPERRAGVGGFLTIIGRRDLAIAPENSQTAAFAGFAEIAVLD